MKKKSIKFNAAINGFRTILNLIFPLITFPYVSRVLSVEELGKYNFSDSIVSYFMLIAALGFNQYAIREGSQYRNDPKTIGEFASKVFSLSILSTVISYILLFVLLWESNKLQPYRVCILILSTQIFFSIIGTEWIFSIFEEYTYIALRSIAFKIISIILLYSFVRTEGDYLYYAIITVIATVGSNVLNFFNAKKYCNIQLTFQFSWKEMMKPILIIFASNIAIQIYVNSDITMLGYYKNDHAVGIYSISVKIYTIIKNVLAAIHIVAIPRLALYTGKQLKKEYNHLLKKLISTLMVIVLPTITGLIFYRKNIILIIAGQAYLESQKSLCILSIAIVFAIFSGLFNQCILLIHKREKIFLKCTIISAISNILLNTIMIPLFSEMGAAITTLISEMSLFIMICFSSKDLIRNIFEKNAFIHSLLSIIAGILSIVGLCLLIEKNIVNIYIQTIVGGILSVILYFFVLILCQNEVVITNLNLLKDKLFYHHTIRK